MSVEAVIVTGQFFDKRLQDTPASVVVLSAKELATSSDGDLYDVVLRTPNVSLTEDERQVAIRGISQGGFGGTSFVEIGSATSGVVLDGVAVSTLGGPLSTWDAGSIEIFRSSQSTNQGRNALAGAILIRSADPTYEWEAKGRAEIASQESRQFAAALNVPIIDGRLAARASVSKEETDGILPNRLDFEDHLFTRAKLRFDATDDLTLTLAYDRADRREGSDLVQFSALPAQVVNAPETRRTLSDVVSLTTRYRFAQAWTLTSITGYLRQQSVRHLTVGALTADITTLPKSASQETRVAYRGETLLATVGAYYLDLDLSQDFAVVAPGAYYGFSAAQIRLKNLGTEARRNYAGFGEVEWRPTPRWTLVGGVRYDRERFRNSQNSAGLVDTASGAVLVAPSIGTPSATTYSAWLPKASVTYNWTPDIATSLLVQRGYRAGGTSVSAVSGVIAPYGPEHTWTYELAVRSAFAGGRGTLNTNIFRIDWTDMQLGRDLSSVPFDTVIQNAGRSRVQGGELSASYRLAAGFQVFAGLGLLRTRFTDFVTDVSGAPVNYNGNHFPFASAVSGNLGVRYRHSSGVFIDTDVAGRSGFFSTSANADADRAKGRTIVNLSAGYDAKRWRLTAFARNLFDTRYDDAIFPSSDIIDLGRPRQAGVTLDVTL